ncbi:hypothetical protein CABS01_04168 [Colletotrichum abscissum]|uniref:uncharacterized protein n=1 Tax=Colletotrichum abscissum TaxID=1671311 RepID=UPI0027D69360|nr:uncharacterized protein CABS01_04168 [Colletotrichum abscissum]KAK1473506.1 hypothetical protein CABS01_04168 [Colletotrichum abscissum]
MVGGVEKKERVARTLLEEPGQGGRTENTSGPGRIGTNGKRPVPAPEPVLVPEGCSEKGRQALEHRKVPHQAKVEVNQTSHTARLNPRAVLQLQSVQQQSVSRFAPRDPKDAMCGEMRKVGSALLKEETEDRLPRLPLGLGPVEVVAFIRWTRQECSCKARYAAREVWEARRTRYWVGQDKQPMQVTVVGMLGDGELNNTNETTGLSWVSDDAEDVADAANEKLKPRLVGLNRRRADATDETTVE